MDATIAKQWVEALRSGKYKQGKLSLKDGDGYCCLGVLCDISPYKAINSFDLYLPDIVRVWAKIWSRNGRLKSTVRHRNQELSSLVGANDFGMSFDEIADIIEQRYLEL